MSRYNIGDVDFSEARASLHPDSGSSIKKLQRMHRHGMPPATYKGKNPDKFLSSHQRSMKALKRL